MNERISLSMHTPLSRESASFRFIFSFCDKTKKKIYVGIKKQEQLLLFREYELTAADINADVSWEELDKLKITFFDFDKGVTIYRDHAYKSGKILFILNFTFDPDRGVFVESSISEELKRELKGSEN